MFKEDSQFIKENQLKKEDNNEQDSDQVIELDYDHLEAELVYQALGLNERITTNVADIEKEFFYLRCLQAQVNHQVMLRIIARVQFYPEFETLIMPAKIPFLSVDEKAVDPGYFFDKLRILDHNIDEMIFGEITEQEQGRPRTDHNTAIILDGPSDDEQPDHYMDQYLSKSRKEQTNDLLTSDGAQYCASCNQQFEPRYMGQDNCDFCTQYSKKALKREFEYLAEAIEKDPENAKILINQFLTFNAQEESKQRDV